MPLGQLFYPRWHRWQGGASLPEMQPKVALDWCGSRLKELNGAEPLMMLAPMAERAASGASKENDFCKSQGAAVRCFSPGSVLANTLEVAPAVA